MAPDGNNYWRQFWLATCCKNVEEEEISTFEPILGINKLQRIGHCFCKSNYALYLFFWGGDAIKEEIKAHRNFPIFYKKHNYSLVLLFSISKLN